MNHIATAVQLYDWIGASTCLIGVSIMSGGPRS
ncbi:hypothetical protein GIW82_11875 [Planomicrobium sp. YIM 101495]|nr:hypothetical protein [Planomicrobium sp. YIM 101495]